MTVSYTSQAQRQLKKLDKHIAQRIICYMQDIAKLANPRTKGKALIANLSGKWRYRVADIRIICEIKDDELVISVIAVEHRRSVYKN